MIRRKAEAHWDGKLRDGCGGYSLGSGQCSGSYSFASRFESGEGSNPDELLGAALASCFSMALSGALVKDGFTPGRISSSAEVFLDKNPDGSFGIRRIELTTEGEVSGADQSAFERAAETAKKNCPVSKSLSVEVVLKSARLREKAGAA